jgi:hypothetical protein
VIGISLLSTKGWKNHGEGEDGDFGQHNHLGAWSQVTAASTAAGFEWHPQSVGDIMALASVSDCTLDADGTTPRSLGPDIGLLSG